MTGPGTVAPDRMIQRGDVTLACYEIGNPDGEVIVAAHGWPDTHHLWDAVTPHLTDEFRIVTYDARGCGQSSIPTETAAFRLNELAEDLHAVINAVSPDAPVHLLAHDWGSITGWEAVCEPWAVQRIASFTSISGPNLDHMGRWIRDSISRPSPKNLRGPAAQLAASFYTLVFMTPAARWYFRNHGSPDSWRRFLQATEKKTNLDNVHLAPTLTSDMVSYLRVYRANILSHLARPRERHTDVPVQLIIPQFDIAVRPHGYSDTDRWATSLHRITVRGGHWLPYSHPQLIATATRNFAVQVRVAGQS